MNWDIRSGLYYTETHEWAKVEDEGAVKAGVTDYAQDKLGGVVFVEMPEEGKEVEKGEGFAVIESVKAVVDFYSPVTGKVVEVNREVEDRPELLNEAPYEEGWIVKLQPHNEGEIAELMQEEQYRDYVIKQEEEGEQ